MPARNTSACWVKCSFSHRGSHENKASRTDIVSSPITARTAGRRSTTCTCTCSVDRVRGNVCSAVTVSRRRATRLGVHHGFALDLALADRSACHHPHLWHGKAEEHGQGSWWRDQRLQGRHEGGR